MKRDYHMHPNLLKVPENADLFAERAAALGFSEICFTDHMPFSQSLHCADRIKSGCVGEYCSEVKKQAKRLCNTVSIKTGIEIDYHPSFISEIKDVLSAGSFDYILASSHLHIAGYGLDLDHMTKSEYAAAVIENYISAAESGLFDAVSHIDIYRWVFSEYPLYDDGFSFEKILPQLHKLFSTLEKTGVILEINAAPLFKCFDSIGPYPEYDILELSKKYDLKYIYGSDAHSSDRVGFGYDTIMSRFPI